MPVLDRADIAAEPVAESHHDPAECLQGHDHGICTQVGANHAAPTGTQPLRQPTEVARASEASRTQPPSPSLLAVGNPSRAPPRV